MSSDKIEDLQPHDRRRFFLEGVFRALRPVSDYVERRLPKPRPRTVIRPPGAIDEASLLETCNRCGNCAEACPAKAIRRLQSGDGELAGTPYIDPDLAPCVLCEHRACMKACTSGALRVVEPAEIKIGSAWVNLTACLLWQGQPCGQCLQKCPRGAKAIHQPESYRVEVIEAGCAGCGVCQYHCPTVPKAISVTPAQ